MPPMIDDEDSGDDVPDMIPAKAKSKAKQPEPEPEPEREAEDDGDEEADDPEAYVVEKILEHDFNKKGELLFQIKWLGYDDDADLTWEPEENLHDAPEVLKAYFKKVGGRPEPPSKSTTGKGKKRSRASTSKRTAADAFADSPAPAGRSKKGRRSNGVAGDGESGKRELPMGSWEDHVLRVTSIIEETDAKGKKEQKELIGLLEWTDGGHKTQHKMKTLRQRVPQKLLDYYEQHLVFTQAGGTDELLDGVDQMAADADADADAKVDEELVEPAAEEEGS